MGSDPMPRRPSLRDILRMTQAVSRGSAVDAPRPFMDVFLEAFRGPTAPSSRMTMQEAVSSPIYQDLRMPKLGVGDPATPFELPLLRPHVAVPQAAGEFVKLADYLGVT